MLPLSVTARNPFSPPTPTPPPCQQTPLTCFLRYSRRALARENGLGVVEGGDGMRRDSEASGGYRAETEGGEDALGAPAEVGCVGVVVVLFVAWLVG